VSLILSPFGTWSKTDLSIASHISVRLSRVGNEKGKMYETRVQRRLSTR
jgi:hypothetical protein